MKHTFLTTDTHFNHVRLWRDFRERPENFEELIHNSHIQLPRDCILIHLGDIGMGKDDLAHEKWNKATGHIKRRILVRGNHDNKSDSWYYERGWSFVCSAFTFRVFGKKILFTHIPKDKKYFEGVDVNIHGHTHGNTHRDIDVKDIYNPKYHLEIALEHTSYKPVLLSEKLINKEDK